uniref:Uncharacterized protein n=1 Tax=Anguilla anguilla TaxID=7936 RepID=A0A0E9SPJ3_ANGAN
MNFVLTLLMLKELHSPCANFVVGFLIYYCYYYYCCIILPFVF